MSDEPPRASLRVTVLGGFRVEAGGRPVPEAAWRRRSAGRVVKLLALTPGHRLVRDRALETLWPDLTPARAAAAFYQALLAARRALEPGLAARARSAHLRYVDEVVSLHGDPLWVDAVAFEQAPGAGAADDPHAVRQGEATLALCPGDLLPDDAYEEWTHARRR